MKTFFTKMNYDIIAFATIRRILHTRHIKHPSRGNRHVRIVVLVPQIDHLLDSWLDNHFTAVIAREQRNVHLPLKFFAIPTLHPRAFAVLMFKIAFISAWQTYMYFVSNSFSPSRPQGSWSSLQPRGKPLYPMPTIWLNSLTILRVTKWWGYYQAPTWVLGSRSHGGASYQTFAAHWTQTSKSHKILIPTNVVVTFLRIQDHIKLYSTSYRNTFFLSRLVRHDRVC